ncbi:MAG: hypothetical protein HY654_04025, partial [Acidobacteria bacterium]|nr:hypothetical protein [Acidobacteriota bacterium]
MDRIDFISAYCDRWCERCAYTSRCSLFAAQAAIAMCGDVVEGLELAVGAPHPEGLDSPRVPEWIAEIEHGEFGAEELAEMVCGEEGR